MKNITIELEPYKASYYLGMLFLIHYDKHSSEKMKIVAKDLHALISDALSTQLSDDELETLKNDFEKNRKKHQ